MDEKLRQAFHSQVEKEPFASKFSLKLLEIGDGYSKVEMKFRPDMENLFAMAHGGALFALIDEALETAANSHGTLAVALNMNVAFIASPKPGSTLRAEAREVSLTRKTASYDIKVHDARGSLVATCMAMVYRKGLPLPFVGEESE
jgi:acyl-CoA thioesterase